MSVQAPDMDALRRVYLQDADAAAKRFAALKEQFTKAFGAADGLRYFSAPGRTEILGNHVDHNGGKILAASVTMDTICAAQKTDDRTVTLVSEGYEGRVEVSIDLAESVPHEAGTRALVAGVLCGVRAYGFQTGGCRLAVSSLVVPSAGVSSSASFETLLCAVMNALYNDNRIDVATYAQIGRYAENHFWEKASGLMDQMACAYGGMILLDFSDGVSVERADFDFDRFGYDLVAVNTGKGHADLSEEYSSIPNEMRMVARACGKETLSEVDETLFFARLPEIRSRVANDRAILRAVHYFEECDRVTRAMRDVADGNPKSILNYMAASGKSSYQWLQNCFVTGAVEEQSIPLCLALSERFLARIGEGVCRVHGGGFAGVVLCALPKAHTQSYLDYLAPYFGREHIYVLGVRQTGATEIGSAII